MTLDVVVTSVKETHDHSRDTCDQQKCLPVPLNHRGAYKRHECRDHEADGRIAHTARIVLSRGVPIATPFAYLERHFGDFTPESGLQSRVSLTPRDCQVGLTSSWSK